MHTSTRLISSDFQFWQNTDGKRRSIRFSDFCPNYHELDRVGVVSLKLEDGVLHTGRTLLALTTAFYDSQRARITDFFDYPQHFAFVAATNVGLETPAKWDAWSWLDVWPANKWITTQPTATAMLQRVFDYQINRLFWPFHLQPMADEQPLPDYLYKMLRTRLKSVYFYHPPKPFADAEMGLEVSASPAAEKLLQESIAKLPEGVSHSATISDRFQLVEIDEFLTVFRGGSADSVGIASSLPKKIRTDLSDKLT